MVADTADGADGVVDSVLAHGRYPDGPRSQPPLAAEGNFNPECAEERLCPAQLLSFAHTNETNIGPLGHAQGVIGLSQRKRRNRAKSPSVQQSVSPCSRRSQMSVRDESAVHARQREKFDQQFGVPFRWLRRCASSVTARAQPPHLLPASRSSSRIKTIDALMSRVAGPTEAAMCRGQRLEVAALGQIGDYVRQARDCGRSGTRAYLRCRAAPACAPLLAHG